MLGEVPGPSSAAIWSAAVAPSAACKYNMKSHTSLMTGKGGGADWSCINLLEGLLEVHWRWAEWRLSGAGAENWRLEESQRTAEILRSDPSSLPPSYPNEMSD